MSLISDIKKARKQADRGPFDGVFLAMVTKVTAAGIFFTLPEYDRVQEFGPAPWPQLPSSTGNTERDSAPDELADFASHDHDIRTEAGAPPANTVCSVFFSEGDPARPYVLAFYGWPS